MSRPMGGVFVYNKTKETFLAAQAQVADSSLRRLIGLLGRPSLDPDSGLWIIPSCAIHTVGMRFPIDILFLDGRLKVVAAREFVTPWSMTRLYWRAKSVLELPVHTIFRSQTEVGDELYISSSEIGLGNETERKPAESSKVLPVEKYPIPN